MTVYYYGPQVRKLLASLGQDPSRIPTPHDGADVTINTRDGATVVLTLGARTPRGRLFGVEVSQ